MPNVSQSLLERIQRRVLKAQKKTMAKLRGEYVIRNGVTFLVVAARKDAFVVSDLTTPLAQTMKFSADAFLSKRVRILKDVEEEEDEVTVKGVNTDAS